MTNGVAGLPLRALTGRIRAGDVAAFNTFIAVHWAPLVRYVTSMVGGVDEAQDVAQEAFVRIWEQREGLRPTASIRAYLYQIARNLALNEIKSGQLHRVLNARHPQERPPVPSPARDVEISELRGLVQAAIAALPERRREAFILAHVQGLPHREIAEIMGVSPQTVANQISAALGELRRTLRPYLADTRVAVAR